MKKCAKCGEDKPFTEYYKNKQQKSGLSPRCKTCTKEYDRLRYAREKERRNAKSREYYQANKDHLTALNKAYYEANKERLNEYRSEWGKRNPGKDREYKDRYHAKNPEVRAYHNALRRARERGAVVGKMPYNYRQMVKDYYGNRCLVPGCDNTEIQVDHVVPLAIGGAHAMENMQTLCASHNYGKSGRNAADYRNGNIIEMSEVSV